MNLRREHESGSAKSSDDESLIAAPKRRLRKSRPRGADWASGNASKYFSYAEAWARIGFAIKQGYFLEAVTIEESIVSDRLMSFLQKTCSINLKPKVTKSLGLLTEHWAAEFELRLAEDPEMLEASRALRSRLDAWRDRRNDVVHGLVKSTAGRHDDHIDNFLEGAERSAAEGKAVARAISRWVELHKKKRTIPT
jgi:hypothetical protein